MIPQEVQTVLRALEQAGHEAYVVGGCVRDMQMGLPPHDWDVTTSAMPEETMAWDHSLRDSLVRKTVSCGRFSVS